MEKTTREQATQIIDCLLDCGGCDGFDARQKSALRMAIDALSVKPCEDAISRQAVLEKAIYTETEEGWSGRTVDVNDIESLPPVTPSRPTESCEDAISRQAAVYVASGFCHSANIADELAKLPPVHAEPKTGHWIMSDDGLCRPICDKCGAHPWKDYIPTVEEATEVFKYCPNCGAKMESEGVKKDCTTCVLDGTDACVSGASDDEVCEGYIAESEEQE